MSGEETERNEAGRKIRQLSDVLLEEFEIVHPARKLTISSMEEALAEATAHPPHPGLPPKWFVDRAEDIRRRQVLDAVHRENANNPRAALCLSGGGIRSASFCLGVIQGLAERGLLKKFHYLSTVSGGGYIGSWLTAWMRRDGAEAVNKRIGKFKENRVLDPEQGPIKHVRNFGNFLIPRMGLFSADMFAAVSVTLRNVIINWLTLLPVLMGALLVPRVLHEILALEALHDIGKLAFVLLMISSIFGAWSISVILFSLPSRRAPDAKPMNESRFLLLFQAPLSLGIVFWMAYEVATFTRTANTLANISYFHQSPLRAYALLAATIGLAPFLLKFGRRLFAKENSSRGSALQELYEDGLPVLATAVVIGGISYWVMKLVPVQHAFEYIYFPGMGNFPWKHTFDLRLFVCLYPALMAVGCWLASTVFVIINEVVLKKSGAGAPLREGAESDREWWGRGGGWMVAIAFAWTLLSALSIYHDELFQALGSWGSAIVMSAGGAAGVASALMGYFNSSTTSDEKKKPKPSKFVHSALTTVGILILLAGLALIAHELVIFTVTRLFSQEMSGFAPFLAVLAFTVGLPLFSFLLSLMTGVNRYSLHSVYGNRLCRAFLGASNDQRKPDPFTNFDSSDNLPLAETWQPEGPIRAPFHIINVALNNRDVSDQRLAWQQRKAQSFTMSPLHCGSLWLGYQPTRLYGGSPALRSRKR